jgi:hypothetical protein
MAARPEHTGHPGRPPGWPRGPLCPPPRTGILEEARDRVCQCCGVDGRDERPGAPVLDDPGEPRHAQRHQRALRERLHRGVAERLYPRRHQHDGGEDGVVGWTYPAKWSAPLDQAPRPADAARLIPLIALEGRAAHLEPHFAIDPEPAVGQRP